MYLARRRMVTTRRPVSRSTMRSGNGMRRLGRRCSTRVSTRPSIFMASPRQTVSTSGSSGMRRHRGDGGRITRTSSFPRVSRWRLCHSKEPSARDRKMRDFCQGFRALGSMDRDLVWLYCVIEDVVRQILGETRLRSRGPTPELTDVESLTIEIFGETLGLNSDASIWRYACDHLRDWFPGLGTEWNFVRRCANLCWLNVSDALFNPSGDWKASTVFRCRCAGSRRDKRFRGDGPSALPSR